MSKDNHLFEDLAKLANSAMHNVAQSKEHIEELFRPHAENIIHKMNLVTRDELEAVHDMAAKARQEQEAMAKELAALKEQLQKQER